MKIFILIFPFLFAGKAFSKPPCQEIEIKSLVVSKSEKVKVCFYSDNESYFISQNCMDLSCDFVQKLKKNGLTLSENSRPGLSTCKALQGSPDTVHFKEGKRSHRRCVFVKDASFISLNMLESWNGKIFTGPGRRY